MDEQTGLSKAKEDSPVPIVAFLGPISSYTHQAALSSFEADRYKYEPADTITGVFDVVQSGEAEMGVVPFENSTNGAVIFTFELLSDRHNLYSDVYVCGEAYLDVSHCLLGRKSPRPGTDSSDVSGACTPTLSSPSPQKPRTAPLYSLKHVKKLYSHPQAFGQCEIFLAAHLKGVERIDVSSTSRAAEIVKEDTTGESAAIASILAAQVHEIDILAKGIEDREDNTTRFLILRKGINENACKTDKTKSLISFTVDHRKPGALASVLHCFQKYDLNLTSINSRPTRIVPFQYIFFLEFEGSRLNDATGKVKNTLDALTEYAHDWRWLGSWDAKL